MTKAAALQEFWSSFLLPAYEENSVPQEAVFPYITYEFISDSFGNDVPMTASLWYRSTSNVEINAKAEEISQVIETMEKPMECDGGRLWIKKGTPFSQPMGDDSDPLVKRRVLNIVAEYLTRF